MLSIIFEYLKKDTAMWQKLARQPWAILAAISIISMFSNFIHLTERVMEIVNAYQTVTHYIWEFLLGWLFDLLSITIPNGIKDYLSISIITAGALNSMLKSPVFSIIKVRFEIKIFFGLLWPVLISHLLWLLYHHEKLGMTKSIDYFCKEIEKFDPDIRHDILLDKDFLQIVRENFSDLPKYKNYSDLQLNGAINYLLTVHAVWIFVEYLCWTLAIISINYGLFFYLGK